MENSGLFKRIQNYFFGSKIKGTEWQNAFIRAQESQLLLSGDRVSYPYTQSLWVRIAINAIATTLSSVPLEFYKGDVLIEDGPLYTLFQDVNPEIDSYVLFEATTTYIELEGDCIWYLQKSRGQAANIGGSLPSAIYPLSMRNFRYVLDQTKTTIVGWMYKAPNGTEIPLTPEEVIHFSLFNPYNPWKGASPIEVLRMTVETDYASQRTNRKLFINSAQPDGIISFESSLSDAAYKRIQADWNAQHQGPENSHRLALMDNKAKFQSLAMNMRDLEFLEGRKMNREEILAMYKVPKFIVGLTEQINYAVSAAAKKIFYTDCIIPLLSRYEQNIQSNFLNKFLGGQNITCCFNLSGVQELLEDMNQLAQTAQIFYNCGVPFNMVSSRLNLGFDNVPGGDVPKPAGGGGFFGPPKKLEIDIIEDLLSKADESKQIEFKPISKGKKLPNMNTVEEREKYWHNMQIPAPMYEKRFSTMFKKIWQEMKVNNLEKLNTNLKKRDFNGWSKNKVAEAVQKDKLDDLIFDFEVFKREFKNASKPIVLQGVNAGGSAALESVDLSIAFDVRDPEVIAWVENHALELAQSLTDTAKEEVKEIIKDGLINGKSSGQIAQEISSYYDTSEAWKAARVARTETQAALNHGASEAYRQSNVVESKEWVANPQRCEDCSDRDGKVFPLDNEDIPLHPNCKCCWAPIVKEVTPTQE